MEEFKTILWIVAGVGLVVFFALYFVNAGYGKFRTSNWGPTIPSLINYLIKPFCYLLPDPLEYAIFKRIVKDK